MRGLRHALQGMQHNQWFISIDVKDGYFNVPIAENDKKYFRFKVGTETFELELLPMGFQGSAEAFRAWLQPFLQTLRHSFPTVDIFDYVDDVLFSLPRSGAREAHILAHRIQQVCFLLNLPLKEAKRRQNM